MEKFAPGQHAFAITPSDGTPLKQRTMYIYVGGAGDVTVKTEKNAAAVLFKACPVGMLLPVAAQYVMATGTTATSLTGIAV
jgi:hypothetical protein